MATPSGLSVDQYWTLKYKALVDQYKLKCAELATLEVINFELKAQLMKYMANCAKCNMCNTHFDEVNSEALAHSPQLLGEQEGNAQLSTDQVETVQVHPDLDHFLNQDHNGTDFDSEDSGENDADNSEPLFEVENGLYKCVRCSKQYRDKAKWQVHYDENHRKIRWPCPFCDLLFTRKAAVKRHADKRHVTQELDVSALISVAINTVEGQRQLEAFKKAHRQRRVVQHNWKSNKDHKPTKKSTRK